PPTMRHARNGGPDHFTQSGRRARKSTPQFWPENVAVVAAEHFISGIARKRHRHRPSCDRANDAGRNLRTVGEGLVVHCRQIRNHGSRLTWGDANLAMVGAKMTRNGFRMRGFVETRLVEAD